MFKDDYYSKLHVWIGINHNENYKSYFELDWSTHLDDPAYIVCGFCRDIGKKWYDNRCMHVIISNDQRTPVDVDVLLGELFVTEETLFDVKEICKMKGIQKANLMFFYIDHETTIQDKDKLYNGSVYIGEFDCDV